MSINQDENSLEIMSHEKSSSTEDCESKRKSNTSVNETSNEKKFTKFEPFLGTIYILLGAISLQFISVIVKKLPYISICQLSLIRNAGSFAIAFPFAVFHTDNILGEKDDRCLQIFRSLFSATAMIFQITAYRYLELVQASIVMSTQPFATAVLARIILKERLGVVETISLIITVCGVLLTLRLPEMLLKSNNFHFDLDYLIGYASSFGFVLCISLSAVLVRKLRKCHFSIILLYSGSFGIIENALLAAFIFPLVPSECGWDVILSALIGILGFICNCFIILAFQKERAGIISVQKSCFEMLAISVCQIVFFSVYPDWYVTVGACLVIASLTTLGVKKCVLTLPQTSKKRQTLKWMLS